MLYKPWHSAKFFILRQCVDFLLFSHSYFQNIFPWKQRFNHNFENCINPLCSCSLSVHSDFTVWPFDVSCFIKVDDNKTRMKWHKILASDIMTLSKRLKSDQVWLTWSEWIKYNTNGIRTGSSKKHWFVQSQEKAQLNPVEQQDSATLLLTSSKSLLRMRETENYASKHEKQIQT